jgi:hypothetical protein
MTVISSNFGSGGAALTPNDSAGQPELAAVLRGLADDANGAPTVLTGLAVTTHVVTLAVPGRVLAVEATTATSAGAKVRKVVGTLAAGEYSVAYSAGGIATITFEATDAVTVCAVEISPANYTSV